MRYDAVRRDDLDMATGAVHRPGRAGTAFAFALVLLVATHAEGDAGQPHGQRARRHMRNSRNRSELRRGGTPAHGAAGAAVIPNAT